MSAVETRTFPLAVLLSITTDRLLCDSFSNVHDAISWFVGDSVGTYGCVMARPMVTAKIHAQYPALVDVDASGVTRENVDELVATWNATYGVALECVRGEYIPPPPVEAWTKSMEASNDSSN